MFLKITLQSQYQGSNSNPGPFNIIANPGGFTFNNVSKDQLISGFYIDVPNNVTGGTITSNGYCSNSVNWSAPSILPTSTATPTLTASPGLTKTATPTLTFTPNVTQTSTPTSIPLSRPIQLSNPPGEATNGQACLITNGLTKYIDFTVPITAGIVIYNDALLTERTYTYDPYNGNFAMLYDPIGANGVNGGKRYSVAFDSTGVVNYQIDCDIASPLPTQTSTPTQTQTAYPNTFTLVTYGTTQASTCTVNGAIFRTVYSYSSVIGPGSVIYTNMTATTLLTGQNYISVQGVVYNINSTTGVVGADSNYTCSQQL